jgi:small subunit ribosomal protein S21
MILLDTRDFKSIDQALKQYKNKHNKLGIVKELRSRQEYTKPSVEKRGKKLKAIYKQQLRNSIES